MQFFRQTVFFSIRLRIKQGILNKRPDKITIRLLVYSKEKKLQNGLMNSTLKERIKEDLLMDLQRFHQRHKQI